jgi:hypothetical protein
VHLMDTKQPLVAAEVDRRARDLKGALREGEARTAMRVALETEGSTTIRVLRHWTKHLAVLQAAQAALRDAYAAFPADNRPVPAPY